MSNHPRRYYGSNELHFITCSCYHRQAWLASGQRRDLFLAVFEQVRERYRFVVVGYVVMPDPIHLLISEPEKGDPSRVAGNQKEPEQWPWSSYRSYAFGEAGAVQINQWPRPRSKPRRRLHEFPPLQKT